MFHCCTLVVDCLLFSTPCGDEFVYLELSRLAALIEDITKQKQERVNLCLGSLRLMTAGRWRKKLQEMLREIGLFVMIFQYLWLDEIASVENKNLSQHPPSYIASHFPTFMRSQRAIIMSEHLSLALSGFTLLHWFRPGWPRYTSSKNAMRRPLNTTDDIFCGNWDLCFTDMFFWFQMEFCVPHCERMIRLYLLDDMHMWFRNVQQTSADLPI